MTSPTVQSKVLSAFGMIHFFWILLNMNLAVKEGWLVSSSLHQVQSFAHSSIQTRKWLTYFSFTDSCWDIIGEGENEQPSIICKVLRLAKEMGGQINRGKAGETARQWKIGGELENDRFRKKRRKVVEKLKKNKCKENKVSFTKMCYHCSLKLSNWEEKSLGTYIQKSRDTAELTRSSPGSSLST